MTERPRKNHFGAKIAARIARWQEQQRILDDPDAYPEIEEPEREKPEWLKGHSRCDWNDWNPWRGD